jgi:hypothetical protein
MRGYKAFQPVAEHRLVVGLLLRLALEGHTKGTRRAHEVRWKTGQALRYTLDDSSVVAGETS